MATVGGPHTVVPPEHNLYSMDRAVNNLEMIIGRLPDGLRNDVLSEQSRTHGDLTELLINKAPSVVTTIVTGLLLKTYISPFTTLLLPIRQLGPFESLNVQWMEINFDQGLAPQVDDEGLARLYTHNKTKRGAVAVRRGVAVKIESGFYMSPEGREEWRQQIEQLATIVQRTNDYDVLLTLLQTPMRNTRHASELGGSTNVYYPERHHTFEERLKLEVDWFGIVNKSEDSRGLTNLVTSMRTTMKKQGVEPDCMVCPPNMLGYYMGSSPDLWEYSSAGPAAAQNRDTAADPGPDSGIRTQTFQGMKLVDTHVNRMTEGQNESPIDLLTVPKQIGEFYPMLTQNSFLDSSSFKNYHTRFRSIRIFNEDHGRLVPIKFTDCVESCLRWDEEGDLDMNRHEDSRVTDDMFLYKKNNGEVGLCPEWGSMEEKYLSEESVHNFVTSVSSRFSHSAIDIVNDHMATLESYSNFEDSFAPSMFDANMNPIVFDRSSGSSYMNAMGDSINKLKSGIITHLMGPMMRAFPSDAKDTQFLDSIMNFLLYSVDDPTTGNRVHNFWAFNEAVKLANVFREDRVDFWTNFLNTLTGFDKLVAATFLISSITKKNMLAMARCDYYVPVDFVLARPYMTYNVSSAIVMKAGQETGETVIGDQRFEMTSNVSDRTLYGNYFYYGKAIVKKDRNVLVAPSVFIQNYVKGNNTTFISEDQLSVIHEESGLLQDTHSLFAFMVPVNDPVADNNVLDIRGQNPGLVSGNMRNKHYASADYYNSILNLESAGLSDPLTQWVDYEEMNTRANSICFLGHTENANGDVIYRNTGHLGPIVYDGVQMSRRPGHYAPVYNRMAK